jgi:hypothetical protein
MGRSRERLGLSIANCLGKVDSAILGRFGNQQFQIATVYEVHGGS